MLLFLAEFMLLLFFKHNCTIVHRHNTELARIHFWGKFVFHTDNAFRWPICLQLAPTHGVLVQRRHAITEQTILSSELCKAKSLMSQRGRRPADVVN